MIKWLDLSPLTAKKGVDVLSIERAKFYGL